MTTAQKTSVTGRIVSIERLTNSYSGNPRFRITLQSADGMGTWNTAADHAYGYEIGNNGRRVDDTVTVTIGGRGTITDLVPA